MPQEVVFVLGDQSEVSMYLSDEERMRNFNTQRKDSTHPEVTREVIETFLPLTMRFHHQLMDRISKDGLDYTEVTTADSPYIRVELDSVPICDSNVIFGAPIIGTVAPLRDPNIQPTITGAEIIHHYISNPNQDEQLFKVHVEVNPAFRKKTIREPNYLIAVREEALTELLREMTDDEAYAVFGTGFVRDGLLQILPATQEFQKRIQRLSKISPSKIEAAYLEAEKALLNEIAQLPIDPRAMLAAILDANKKIGVVSVYLREAIMQNLQLPPTRRHIKNDADETKKGIDVEVYHFRPYDLLQNTFSGICMPITTVLPEPPDIDSP